MKKTYLKYLLSIIVLFMPLFIANANPASIDTSSNRNKPIIAVLSFVNHSPNSKAYSLIMDQIYTQLDSLNINYISHQDLRPTLRKHRIRTLGTINEQSVLDILNSTRVDRIMLGSINIYDDNLNPEISISIRIIDAKQMNIIAAVSHSATGSDFEKLFGIGAIESINLLTNKIVKDLIIELFKKIDTYDADINKTHSSIKVAIIPFDNISENKNAGLISMNILLTSLINNGYTVIEPGVIEDIMFKNKRVLRGEIDLLTLAQLKNELHIDLLITGTIEKFELFRGSRLPEIELGLRTLDASNGKILIMFNDSKKGNDSESVFEHGKINAMGKLLTKSFKEYLFTLEKKSEQYFAKQN